MTSEMENVLYRSDIRRESDKRVYGNLLHRAWHTLALTFRYYCSGIMLAWLPWHHATIICLSGENNLLIISLNPGLTTVWVGAESLTDPC